MIQLFLLAHSPTGSLAHSIPLAPSTTNGGRYVRGMQALLHSLWDKVLRSVWASLWDFPQMLCAVFVFVSKLRKGGTEATKSATKSNGGATWHDVSLVERLSNGEKSRGGTFHIKTENPTATRFR